MADEEIGIDDAVTKAMQIMEESEAPDNAAAQTNPLKNSLAKQGEAGASEMELTEETEEKPDEQEPLEAEKPIEPPASWRSDEKELFKGLPRDVQETITRVQQAADSHFTQRSTELAQKIRATDDERQQYQTERARHLTELGRLSQMAAQLLPAKFQDIQSESDYLRLKATDPARASEYEAFRMTLDMANKQQEQLQKASLQEHLTKEYQQLAEKFPEFRDVTKASALLDGVRKTAVEYYGFSPQEVQVIQDHRYVPILQDAMAWRQYQANMKAAQTKKTVTAPTKVLRATATTGQASLADDQKMALLKRASKTTNDREKAEILAGLIG